MNKKIKRIEVGSHIIKMYEDDWKRVQAQIGDNEIFFIENKKNHLMYPASQKNGKTMLLARIILDLGRGFCIKYIDKNSCNLLRGNLAKITDSQKKIGSKKTAGLTSKYLGVHWTKHARKWKAQIKPSEGKAQEYLGYFEKEDDAAKAYNTAAVKYFGQLATLNVIPKKKQHEKIDY